MNLVQLQERLKDAPTQALMQYANGGNPMVPPYIALAELKRRESINQGAQAQQAMQQGQPPSVKEQIEQTAGLAALKQQMQQQGMQNLMQQVRPQGIPENVPQPQQQPKEEGIAGLPVGDMYNFADGGIVAFSKGGDAMKRLPGETEEEYTKRLLKLAQAGINTKEITLPPIDKQGSPAAMQNRIPAGKLPLPGGITTQKLSTALPPRAEGIAPVSPEAQGIQSLEGGDEARKMIVEAMRAKPSAEQAYKSERELAGLYGLTQPAGEERMGRAKQMEEERAKMLEGRGMERLMRVMGGIAGSGLQGAAPAYLSAIEGERASDVKFRKEMDELAAGIEEKRRAEAATGMQRAQQDIGKQRELGLGAAEKLADWERRRQDEVFKLKLQKELGKMTPTEGMILQNVIDDLLRKDPNMTLAEAFAKAIEMKQGLTPEIKKQQRRTTAYEKAAALWENMLVKPEGMTKDQFIEDYVKGAERAATGTLGASQAGMPDDVQSLLKQYGRKM